MLALDQRVLSKTLLNAEPSPSSLVAHFLTPPDATFHRNHGPWLDLPPDYALTIASEVPGLTTTADSTFTCAQLAQFPKESVVTVLACAGNRRQKMSLEKETEGLQWGKSALANTHFAGASLSLSSSPPSSSTSWLTSHSPLCAGALLRDVLAKAGIKLDELDKDDKADKLHIHFESQQECEDDSYYGASLPLRMALCVLLLPHELSKMQNRADPPSFLAAVTPNDLSSSPTR